ncbi:MAG TPA: mannosyltransferase family protein [Ktedonobacterales bacterium]|nr:mannosyltransferase family protein [Ktedonobacterales bacterium]
MLAETLPRVRRVAPPPQRTVVQRVTQQIIQRRALLIPLAIALVSRAVILVVADLIMRFAIVHRHYSLPFTGPISVWQRKDALWYVRIAQTGYDYSPVAASRANFFPLYPLLIHIFTPVAAILPVHEPYALAGMIISWVTFVIACVGLYRLARDHFGERVAVITVTLLALFPFSLYYGAAYTESIYLVLAVWAFVAIERGNWWAAAALAGIASASRPPGLLIGGCVGLAYLIDWYRTRHRLRLDILSLALVPVGTASYMLYCWVRWGDPLAYVKTSRAGWNGGHLQLTGLRFIGHVLIHPISWIGTFDGNHEIDFVAIVLMLCFLGLTALVFRYLGPVYALFSLASVMAPVLDFPNVNSLGRYLSVIFPVFMVVAYLLRDKPRVVIALSTIGGILLLLGATYFIAGYGMS